MSAISHCPKCGARLSPGLLGDVCPNCALQAAFEFPAQAEPAATLTGKRFGDYELLEEIARGGMGIVYKARQTSLHRLVALKVVLFGPHASAEYIKRFRIEASAAAALQHPNIVAIHEVGVHDGEHFLVMDYVDGPTLARFVKEQPLPAKRAAQYLKGIAEAIHYAHEHGILHRDLKPSNVLIDANDRPRVTDFGLAKRMGTDSQSSMDITQLTLSGQVVGSPGYMPPEQATGSRGKMSRRSDVYSLGAMLYHLLTGRPPFAGESLAITLDQVQHHDPVSPRLLNPYVPRDLETICLKCLEKEPQRRYESAAALARDLECWMNHEPIQARRIDVLARTARWARRNPVGATLIGSLVIGLAVSLSLVRMLATQKNAAEQAQARTEHARTVVLDLLGVSGFWDDKSDTALEIPSHILALASGAQVARQNARPPERCRLGLLVEEDPAATVIGYAALLAALEKNLNRMGRNVHFEITLFKKNKDGIDALANGRIDILKIGGNSYLKAKARDPDIRPLVSQNPPKRGVIFVRESSEIGDVRELAQCTVAFGDRYSTISTWAYYHLVQAGVTNLKHVAFLDSIAMFESDAALRSQEGTLSSHLLTIRAVLTNGYDAGVCSESTFLRSGAPRGMRSILTFTSDPVWWVIGSSFRSDLEADLRLALVNLRDSKLFRGISKRITHYLPADDADVNAFRQAMAVAAEHFGPEDEKHK